MTDKEKAIVMAYTGICMLTGDKFQIFHKYVEDIMNRPIMTHELGWLEDEIKEKSKADFMALCANESNSEIPNKSEIPTGLTTDVPENNVGKIEPTKNYLGVDCVSRQEVDRLARIYLKEPTDNNVAFYEDFLDLPSVTPIRPKGHWINKSHSFESCSAECSACHNRSNGYMLDNGFSLECKYYDFCPHCGAKMEEVEE